MNYRKDILEYIELEREVLSKLDIDALNEAMELIEKAYKARLETLGADHEDTIAVKKLLDEIK